MTDSPARWCAGEHPVSLGDHGLVGAWHVPTGEPTGGLVFCAPLFEERKSAHRAMVEAARALCEAGFLVLRFDYRGCGDSPGAFSDSGPDDWDADAQVAFSALADALGVAAPGDAAAARTGPPLGLLGLRYGAVCALRTAVAQAADFLILWEPVLSGRDYLDEECRKAMVSGMVTFGRGRGSRRFMHDELAAGRQVDLDGYAVSPLLGQALQDLDLGREAESWRGKTLLVQMRPLDRPTPAVARLSAVWESVDRHPDIRCLVGPPFWRQLGLTEVGALIDGTRAWCNAVAGGTVDGRRRT